MICSQGQYQLLCKNVFSNRVIVTTMILLKGLLPTALDCCSSVPSSAKKQAATLPSDQYSLRLTNQTYTYVQPFVKYPGTAQNFMSHFLWLTFCTWHASPGDVRELCALTNAYSARIRELSALFQFSCFWLREPNGSIIHSTVMCLTSWGWGRHPHPGLSIPHMYEIKTWNSDRRLLWVSSELGWGVWKTEISIAVGNSYFQIDFL